MADIYLLVAQWSDLGSSIIHYRHLPDDRTTRTWYSLEHMFKVNNKDTRTTSLERIYFEMTNSEKIFEHKI